MKVLTKTAMVLVLVGIVISMSTVPANAVSEATCIFLLIEPGSRAGGMGHSFVSIADDAFATWWNPGAIAFLDGPDVGLMHSNWFGDVIDDIYYEYLSYLQKFEGIGTLGFNITYITYGEQLATRPETGDPIRMFTSYEIAAGVAYGAEIAPDLGIGINLKGVISGLAPDIPELMGAEGEGYTFVFDVGVLKKNLFTPGLSLGVNLQNFGPDIRYKNSKNSQPMPFNLRAGLSYKILDSEYSKLIATADINKMLVNDDPLWKRWFTSLYDDDFDYEIDSMIENVGIEYTYYDLISLRFGYVHDVAGVIKDYSFGAGLKYEFSPGKELRFDFALQPGGEMLEGGKNKTFSLALSF